MNYQKQNKNYFNPVNIIKTSDWFKEAISIINSNKKNNPIIITSTGNNKRFKLHIKFKQHYIIDDVPSNPTIQYCNKKLNEIQNMNFDCMIAIGGGSVMDAAKVLIAGLNLNNNCTLKLIKYNGEIGKKILSIFIPTTHGTGSEVTMWGTVWDMQNKLKYSISNPDLYPNHAILDYRLTESLPEQLSLITSMDALSHSLESIWNVNRNDKSTKYAIDAIVLILNTYNKCTSNSLSSLDRENLLLASTLAGLAFSNTKTAIAHSISYPLTIDYNMPHGIASSITLIPLLILSENYIKNELNELYSKLSIMGLNELINKIESIYYNKLNYKLRSWGVEKDSLPELVKKCYTKDRIENYIVSINENNMLEILKKIY